MSNVILNRPELDALSDYRYGWADSDIAGTDAKRGLSEEVIRNISEIKNEPEWMLKNRLKALNIFYRKPMPTWGADLSEIDFDNIKYFVQSTEGQAKTWEDLPEDIKATYDRLGIPEAERNRLVAGVTAQYECLSAGSRIWTTRGQVRADQISNNDTVFSLNEETGLLELASVKAVHESGIKKVYDISVQGKTLRASGNHPFLALIDRKKEGRQRKRFNREWTALNELHPGDVIGVPRVIPEFGASYLLPGGSMPKTPTASNPDLLWLLGFFIGDGNLVRGKGSYKIQFAVHNLDVSVVEEITRLSLELFGLDIKQSKDNYRLTLHSKALLEWMEELGFKGTAHTKIIPDWVFSLPSSERLAFLGGWVDADGYVGLNNSRSVALTSVNISLLKKGAELARLAGLTPAGPWKFTNKHPLDKTRELVGYRLGISGNFELLDCRNLKRTSRFGRRKYFYSNASSRSVTLKSHITDHLGFATIKSIKAAGEEKTYDIEVEKHHNFIAEGMIVHNSTVVYHQIQAELEAQGVIFTDTDTALREHPEFFTEYFGTVIPAGDNKFAALNTAAWSGGSFVYVPPNVHVKIPLQAYFRINTENMGQFERTLIIADEGSSVSYFEGCLLSGEEIALADGSTKVVEDILKGDIVRDHTGKSSKVKALMKRHFSGTTYTFKPISTGNTFTTTGEHPILIVPRAKVLAKRKPRKDWKPEVNTKALLEAKPEWVKAEKVHAGDFLIFPKNQAIRPEKVLPRALGKLAGYYLAEGSSSLFNKTYKVLSFSFHMDEVDYVEEVRDLAEELYGTRGSVYVMSEKNSATVSIYTNEGYDFMKENIGDRSWNKRLSPLVFNQSNEFIEALIEGYMNGDGSLSISGSNVINRASTTSREWAFQLQSLMSRLNIFATVRLERKAGPAVIMGRNVVKHNMYKVFWTTGRSMGEVRYAEDYFLVPIKTITEEFFEGTVYNFETNPSNSYLAKGFAVHNCSAPIYSTDSLHSAVVEIIVKKNASVNYTTIQNWSNNVYNLVTKRATVQAGGRMEWVDVNSGCLAEGSTVTTPSGVIPIEQVEVGDLVLSYDDVKQKLVFQKVLGKKFSGNQSVKEMNIGERRIKVTDNHPFYSYFYDESKAKKSGRYSLGYVRADKLEQAIIPNFSLDYGTPKQITPPSTDSSFIGGNQYQEGFLSVRNREVRLILPEETTDDILWLLGAFTGDGSIQTSLTKSGKKRCSKITFSIPTTDRAHQKILQVMSVLLPDATPNIRADGISVHWNSIELAQFIEDCGFVTGAYAKQIPDWIKNIPESQRLSFIAGYIDTDGCASKGKRGFSIKSVNKGLLKSAAGILTTLGITSRLHTEFEGERPGVILGREVALHGSHNLVFTADRRLVAKVTSSLQKNVEEQPIASLKSFRQIGRSSLILPNELEIRKIRVSDSSEVLPTWDIEVEGTGNFVAEGFIVHNSKVTMKYPSIYLMGEHAHGETISAAFAGAGQHQDAGAKMIHMAPHTTSSIISKSVARAGGRSSYRGEVKVAAGAHHSASAVRCDALLIDTISRSDTYPSTEIREDEVSLGHEATVSRVGEEQLFYLMSRGVVEEEAMAMIVRGFVEPVTRKLPMEYALEFNTLIGMQMEGSVG